MINDENDSRTLSSSSDSIIIPVTTDNNKLEWDGNPATISGMLFEVDRFYTRVGLVASASRRQHCISMSSIRSLIEMLARKHVHIIL